MLPDWAFPDANLQCESLWDTKEKMANRGIVEKVLSKVTIGWIAGVYDGISRLLSTSKLNMVIILLPLALCVVAFAGLSENSVLGVFIGVLAAGIVSFVLQWTLWIFVAVFAGAIGFLIWLQSMIYVSIETAIHVRHLVKQAREIREKIVRPG